MSTAKHTPGPWEETKGGFIHGPVRKPRDHAVQVSVCRVSYPFRPLNKEDPWEMQFPANARLIAAAPELYDIVLGLMEYHGPGTCPDHLFEAGNNILRRIEGEE